MSASLTPTESVWRSMSLWHETVPADSAADLSADLWMSSSFRATQAMFWTTTHIFSFTSPSHLPPLISPREFLFTLCDGWRGHALIAASCVDLSSHSAQQPNQLTCVLATSSSPCPRSVAENTQLIISPVEEPHLLRQLQWWWCLVLKAPVFSWRAACSTPPASLGFLQIWVSELLLLLSSSWSQL